MLKSKTRFNVAFHGLFVFVQRPSRIDVLVPNMGSTHVYRAGEWLGEITYPEGDYAMTLAKPAPATGTFDPTKNIIVPNAKPAKTTKRPRNVYARFTFPKPSVIHSLRSVDLANGDLDHDPKLTLSSRVASVIQILSYDDVTVDDITFDGIALPAKGGNLHIFAGPDQRETHEHTLDGFSQAASLLTATKGKLRLRNSPQAPQIKPNEVPEGFGKTELIDLSDRVKQLAAFGRKLRDPRNQAKNIDGKRIFSVPSDVTAFDTDVRACLGLIGDFGRDT